MTKLKIEIMQLIITGMTHVQIAIVLGISRSTVDGHTAEIIEILGAENMYHAIAIAMRRKLIR